MSALGRMRGPFSFILELAQFQLMADKNGERERERERERRTPLEALFNREGNTLYRKPLLFSTVDWGLLKK